MLIESALVFFFVSFREALLLLLLIITIFFLTVWAVGRRSKDIRQSEKS